MANWYVSRERVKRAGEINGAAQDGIIDRIIEAVSVRIDRETRRWFIPRTATRLYPWPQYSPGLSYRFWLDADLLSITTLKTKAQDSSPTTIVAADYFLEPANESRYNRIEIDLSSTAAFESGTTRQRSISILGSWGFGNDAEAAGTVVSGLASDAAATSFVGSDGSLIDVGDTLLIGSEQVFITARANAQVGSQTTNGALAASVSTVAVTVGDGTLFFAGEVILIESERMYVESISGNVLTVVRAYDGTTLASHVTATAVHAFRTFTIVRGVNGTTAAVHANATAVSRYTPIPDIRDLALAASLVEYQQHRAGWGRSIGVGDGAVEFRGGVFKAHWDRVISTYRRSQQVAI